MRATDCGVDVGKARARWVRTVLGLVLAGLGVLVALKQPEHGGPVALLLVGAGCGMIEPTLVKRIFKP